RRPPTPGTSAPAPTRSPHRRMFTSARTFARVAREPLRLVGVLWPLALLVPFVPGLPRPTNGGLTWRQEGTVALLLCATFALLWRRALKSRREGRAAEAAAHAADLSNIPILEIVLVASLAAFVVWGAASTASAR